MKNVYMDCAEDPQSNCTVKISGSEDEVMRVSMRHAVEDHKYPNNKDTRNKLKSMIKAS